MVIKLIVVVKQYAYGFFHCLFTYNKMKRIKNKKQKKKGKSDIHSTVHHFHTKPSILCPSVRHGYFSRFRNWLANRSNHFHSKHSINFQNQHHRPATNFHWQCFKNVFSINNSYHLINAFRIKRLKPKSISSIDCCIYH